MLDALQQELSEMIVKTCKVEDPLPITADQPLIGPDSPYGLDSLDAVEVVVAVQKNYGIKLMSQEDSRQALTSLATLAEFIRTNQK